MRVIVVGDTGTKDAVIAAPFTDDTVPILFVKKDEIPTSVTDELYRLAPTEILVFGGALRVSDAVVTDLEQHAPVTRIAGSSVFATAIAASQALHPVVPPVEPPVEPPPDDSVILIPAGIHAGYTTEVEDGKTYRGEDGAILDGNGTVTSAFTGSADGVTIENLEIKNYDCPPQVGAIHLTGNELLVKDCEVHHNRGVGVKLRFSNRSVIVNNRIHHNHQLGISYEGDDGLVQDNTIGFNNWLQENSWGFEAGGTKFWNTINLTVRGNHAHDNHGPGLWTDHDNIGTLYEGNLVEDNHACGIFHEISYGATIRNNIIRRNGITNAGQGWLWAAGIVLASVQDVEVYENDLEGNYNGISLSQQDRGSGVNGEYVARNNTVYNNTVNGGKSGAVRDTPSDIFDADNRWYGNTYNDGHGFAWDNQWGDLAWWQAFHPQDG